jgi:hypothetical protein
MIYNVMPGENKETLPKYLNNLFDRTRTDSSKEQSCAKFQFRQVDEEDGQKDPGVLLVDEVDLEAGRTHQKKMCPVLPRIKRRNTIISDTKDILTIGEVVKPCDSVPDLQKVPWMISTVFAVKKQNKLMWKHKAMLWSRQERVTRKQSVSLENFQRIVK